MPILLANLKLQFKAFGEVDFVEVSMSAVNVLNSEGGNVTDATIHASQTIKHLMIDEFQDLNNLQMTIVKSLMSAWTKDERNSLFLVYQKVFTTMDWKNGRFTICYATPE